MLIRCKETFSTPPILSSRFTSSTSSQYHSVLPSLSDMALYIQQQVCRSTDSSCQAAATSLLTTTYLDLDFDMISHALTVTAFWHKEPNGQTWNEKIDKVGRDGTIEVGVLNREIATEPEEISLGGFLTVVGEDVKSSTCTLFPPPLTVQTTNFPSQAPHSSHFPPATTPFFPTPPPPSTPPSPHPPASTQPSTSSSPTPPPSSTRPTPPAPSKPTSPSRAPSSSTPTNSPTPYSCTPTTSSPSAPSAAPPTSSSPTGKSHNGAAPPYSSLPRPAPAPPPFPLLKAVPSTPNSPPHPKTQPPTKIPPPPPPPHAYGQPPSPCTSATSPPHPQQEGTATSRSRTPSSSGRAGPRKARRWVLIRLIG